MQALRSDFVSQLAKTETVSRLAEVSFLGAIDYSPWARRVGGYLTSRFDHSLGVALLANDAAKALEVNEAERKVAVAAGLLHDIGHGPLSHSLESAFERRFGLNHHSATTTLLIGSSARARELRSVLARHDVDVDEVLALMVGEHPTHPMSELFSGPINLDTIEGILRSVNYRGNTRKMPKLSGVLAAATSIVAGDRSATAIGRLDEFWLVKGLIYSQLVRGPIGLLSDFKCQHYFDTHSDRFHPTQFAWSDSALKEEFPELFAWLAVDDVAAWKPNVRSQSIHFVRRSFTVNASMSNAQETTEFLRARYRQHKTQAEMSLPLADLAVEEELGTWQSQKLTRDVSTATV